MAPTFRKHNRHLNSKRKPPMKTDKSKDTDTKRVSVKNQIRSLRRLLSKKDLPDEVRRAKEQQIAELEGRIQKVQRLEKYRLRHKKTAAIRFFERRKAERKL